MSALKSMYCIAEDEDINHNLILQHFVLQVKGEATKQVTGEMEITVTRKDGQKQVVHSKKGGDGVFSQQNAAGVMKNKGKDDTKCVFESVLSMKKILEILLTISSDKK
ncbi:hypothetical protein pb186bvf_018204 [Paramecium bursaria]